MWLHSGRGFCRQASDTQLSVQKRKRVAQRSGLELAFDNLSAFAETESVLVLREVSDARQRGACTIQSFHIYRVLNETELLNIRIKGLVQPATSSEPKRSPRLYRSCTHC